MHTAHVNDIARIRQVVDMQAAVLATTIQPVAIKQGCIGIVTGHTQNVDQHRIYRVTNIKGHHAIGLAGGDN